MLPLFTLFYGAGSERDVKAGPGQVHGDRLADAATSPGDESSRHYSPS